MAGYRSQLLAGNIKPVQVFSFDHGNKNAADIELVVDALEVAADMPWIELFVIVSGDGDFVPLIRRLHALGKRSFVATTSQPAAGIVNKLLPSVADYFHRIEVPPAPGMSIMPAAVQVSPKATKAPPGQKIPAAKTPTAKKAPTAKKTAAAHPELKLYRASVLKLMNEDPTLWVNGQVKAPQLGKLLRERWPDVTYKTFGFATLTRFVEECCGLKIAKSAASSVK